MRAAGTMINDRDDSALGLKPADTARCALLFLFTQPVLTASETRLQNRPDVYTEMEHNVLSGDLIEGILEN